MKKTGPSGQPLVQTCRYPQNPGARYLTAHRLHGKDKRPQVAIKCSAMCLKKEQFWDLILLTKVSLPLRGS
jgi:hypothetical protein